MHQAHRFIIINVFPRLMHAEEAVYNLEELISLVHTYNQGEIVKIIQRKDHPDPHTYIGKGKTAEVANLIEKEHIDVVILNSIVKPTQLFNLTKMFWEKNPNIEVWDRVDLILHIFDKHAKTAEAKLQIELARMRHMGPRVYGLGGTVLSRQGGGIGTRGIGETNVELMKRHWRNEIKRTKDKLAKLTKNKESQLMKRKESGFLTISIVGYTNAGKSTLFNTLTKKKKGVKDALFATLDSAVGKWYLPSIYKEVLVSDTIGFIQNLPPELIDAFKSTLLESVHATLLLHVIDVSDPNIHEKIDVVENILSELGLENKPKIYVFNKTDNLPDQTIKTDIFEMYHQYNPQFISAQTGDGLTGLRYAVEEFFQK
jgi:GTP-binding protein HflX